MKALGKMSPSWATLGQQGCCTCNACTGLLKGTVLNTAWMASKFSLLVGAIRKFTKENQLSMKCIAKVTEQDVSHAI